MSKRMILKRRKKRSIKKYIFLFLFLVLLFFSLFYVSNIIPPIKTETFLKSIIKLSNHHINYDYNKKSIVTSVLNFFSFINLEEPTSIIDNSYKGLVDLQIDLQNESCSSHETKKDTLPVFYIYNTHPLETYATKTNEEYNVNPDVLLASYILREKLSNYGIESIVETNNVSDILKFNNWNYAASYQVSKMFMLSAKEDNPKIEYYIDVHRDSAKRNITYCEIDGVSYARILFIVGLENPNYEANLKMIETINKKLEEKYPGISRGIYKKEGPLVDGVYNQDVSDKVMLVEMGGVDNTIEEVLHSTSALASILYDYVKGE